MEEHQRSAKLQKAIKRLTILKGFYNHLVVYLIVNILGLAFFIGYRIYNTDKFEGLDAGFRHWIDWNIVLIPTLWAIGLFAHWLYANYRKPKF